MPEPASAALRRLILACDPSTVRDVCLLVDARGALADLAASVEECASLHCRPGGFVWQGVTSAPCGCSHCASLAALRERLGAKP